MSSTSITKRRFRKDPTPESFDKEMNKQIEESNPLLLRALNEFRFAADLPDGGQVSVYCTSIANAACVVSHHDRKSYFARAYLPKADNTDNLLTCLHEYAHLLHEDFGEDISPVNKVCEEYSAWAFAITAAVVCGFKINKKAMDECWKCFRSYVKVYLPRGNALYDYW